MCVCVCTAGAPEVGQLQSSLYSSDTLLFGSPVTEAATTFASPANRAPPVATVMPLHSSYNLPSSVQPTAEWSEPQAPVTAEASVGSRRVSAAPSVGSAAYFPVPFHWFYSRNIELRQIWQPFSVMDSTNLELAHQLIVSGMFSNVLIFLIFNWLVFKNVGYVLLVS